MRIMKELDEFLSKNKDRKIRLTKVKILNGKRSNLRIGETFVGQASLKYFEDDPTYGTGCFIALDGGWIMKTSPLTGAVRKGPSRWLVRTLTSVYRVEVLSD